MGLLLGICKYIYIESAKNQKWVTYRSTFGKMLD